MEIRSVVFWLNMIFAIHNLDPKGDIEWGELNK